jgi:hypothetical protein
MSSPAPLTMFYEEPHRDTNRWLRPALMSSEGVEWYTPPHIRDAVVQALGGRVDLDPCADPERTFPAAEHFTKDENGLARTWVGRIYMNPPYGREIVSWTTKLRDQLYAGWVTEAVALLPARVDTGWWHDLRPETVCFIRGRLQFSGYDCSAPFPSAAIYFGDDPARFVHAFTPLGQLYASLESGR